jgi:hypothetical protein
MGIQNRLENLGYARTNNRVQLVSPGAFLEGDLMSLLCPEVQPGDTPCSLGCYLAAKEPAG